MTAGLGADRFWDREVVDQTHVSWMKDPLVHESIRAAIGGDEALWPIDWLQRWLKGRRFRRALSIGCGGGALERDLLQRGICDSIDAFDGSVMSLHRANEAAAAAGVRDRVRYFASDFNQPVLPRRTYDAVFFHQSAHHVSHLEKLFSAVLRAMKPDGVLYLDEYVGPSRFQWNDELIAPHQAIYGRLPAEVRTLEQLPLPIQADDHSEAVRSNDIEPQLAVGFRTVARRPYGGNLLSVLFPYLRREHLTETITRDLIARERRLLEQGAPSYYTVIIARPRRLAAALIARAVYWTAPKIKARLGYWA
jgi:SAM-dependent methyltransferase